MSTSSSTKEEEIEDQAQEGWKSTLSAWELSTVACAVGFNRYPGCKRLFLRGFRFRSSPKKWPARKASEPERHPFHSAEPITTPLTPKHTEYGCFADWFLGDIEYFKCSDWITITIGAWSEREWFEGDKDLIQTIQAHITYVFTFWKRIENIKCLYDRKISIRQ